MVDTGYSADVMSHRMVIDHHRSISPEQRVDDHYMDELCFDTRPELCALSFWLSHRDPIGKVYGRRYARSC